MALSQRSDRTPIGSDAGLTVAECMNLLRHKGFQQSIVRDELAGADAVMFNRVWRGIRDTVLAYSESEALAYRVRETDVDPADPFTVDPDRKIWYRGGEFVDVSNQLLALPPPPGHSVFATGPDAVPPGGCAFEA
jgi:hypothetical protein